MDNPITWCLRWVVLVAGSEKFFLWELCEYEFWKILLPVVYSYDGVYRPDDGSNELKHVVL
jgi:hypothetical protein